MTQEAQANIVVRSQLIPLDGMRIVLPNTAIAEVVSYMTPVPVVGSPDMVIGSLDWRGLTILLLAFETACTNKTVTANRNSRIVVLNAINKKSSTPFYAVLAQGIPRLMSLEESDISKSTSADTRAQDYVLSHCIIGGQQVIIPDQDGLEKVLKNVQTG